MHFVFIFIVYYFLFFILFVLGPHYIDDLETMLDESMLHSFNTEIEDGSFEEVCFL